MPASSSSFSSVLCGAESLLIQCGEILLDRGHEIRAVATRSRQIEEWAEAKGLALLRPGKNLAASLSGVEFDYFFSITNLAMLGEDLLALPRVAAINFHDGPLPRYAGMYAPAWAIANGETEYGVSFHEMSVGADEGGVYVQRMFPIAADETSLTINTSCYGAAIDAFGELVDGLADGSASATPQDLSQRSYFGRYERPEAAALLDWSRSPTELTRLVRATQFGRYDNAFTSAKLVHCGQQCLVGAAEPCEGTGAPGELLEVSTESLVIAATGGAVALSDLGTTRGASLEPAEAVSLLGLSLGQIVALPDAADRARLSELCEGAARAEAYWVRRLSKLDPVEIPYLNADRPSDSMPAHRRFAFAVPDAFQARFGEAGGVGVASAFAAYLARVSGRVSVDLSYCEDRWNDTVAGLEGFFSTQVPLRVEFATDASAGDAVGALASPLCDRSGFALDVIARYPELCANPLFARGGLGGVAVACFADADRFEPTPGTDFALVLHPDGTRAQIVHDENAVSVEAADRIADQLAIFLAGLCEAELPLGAVSLLDPETREQMLRAWNDTSREYPRSQCVHELFEAQAARTPDATAVVFEDRSLSYRELSVRSSQLANHLRAQGVGADRLVGLFLDRSIEMIVGMLGVLKAGGAYVPLDPSYPSDRIAYMIDDSKAKVILVQEQLLDALPQCAAEIVAVDRDWHSIGSCGETAPETDTTSENLAYVIYTSGSTGVPKGVMVEHRNVVNFFAGMDERIPHDPPGSWLAVTSLSFDISVLELLWTLTRGFRVVVHADRERDDGSSPVRQRPWRPMEFGLAMWGSDAGPGPAKYELMLESARYADQHGFTSFHTPERHFGAFGGPYPNPSVTSAAIAAVTEKVRIRASSCVLPLHHPVRVAEEWAVVDNLSNGRVEMSVATGWQPNDFVIRPEGHGQSSDARFENVDVLQRLWRGESVEFENPMGQLVPTATLPRPVQKELKIWITSASNIKTFEEAGAHGYNLLTHLLGQNLAEVSVKIAAYRRARAANGHDPKAGVVTLMLHSFVGKDDEAVREIVREPMKDYLASAMSLVVGFAWSFPAFVRPGGPDQKPEDVDLASLTEEETDTILEFAFERYYETSGLFGTPEACLAMVERVKDADVDEICCLIDFGVDKDQVLSALDLLGVVRRKANEKPVEASRAETGADYSIPAQVAAHGVSHLQCTPSMAQMLATNPDTRECLRDIAHLMIGGEAFPVALAAELDGLAGGSVTNMYGPTETTIWSSTQSVVGSPSAISIGTPIANTQLYILDQACQPLPVGIAGELMIGGDGVVRGYFERPELTEERFVADPYSDRPGARLYRTGDLARFQADGTIDFLGRLDHQVKIRGYRIELGEIEARLGAIEGVKSCVVLAREDTPGDQRLVAYLESASPSPDDSSLRLALRAQLPEFMVPSAFVSLESFPQTPNGKIDRKALPAPEEVRAAVQAVYSAPENELEATIADVWKQVLHMDTIGIDDNFFDLGGHSLLVVQAHRKLRESGPASISLTDLYRFPTIRGLAGFLGSDETPGAAVKQSQERGEKRRQAAGRRRRRGGA